MTDQPVTRQQYSDKVKAELDKLNAQIDELKAKASQARAEASISYHSQVEELDAKRDAVRIKFEQIQQATEDAWAELQSGFEQAWNDLVQAVQNASSKFQ